MNGNLNGNPISFCLNSHDTVIQRMKNCVIGRKHEKVHKMIVMTKVIDKRISQWILLKSKSI